MTCCKYCTAARVKVSRGHETLGENRAAITESLLLSGSANTIADPRNSETEHIKRGVQEGSPLSPALFNFYVKPPALSVQNSLASHNDTDLIHHFVDGDAIAMSADSV